MRILHLIPTMDPAYGGPVAALRAADASTRRRGIVRTVATLDLERDPWIGQGPLTVVPLGHAVSRRGRQALPWLRYGFTPRLVPWLRDHAARHDRVVVHGLWNYMALAARCVLPGAGIPYFVFPHGMLDPWFRVSQPAKHRLKQLSWWANEGPLLHGAQAVLFTSAAERAAARNSFRPWRLRAVVAGYGTGDAPDPTVQQAAAFAAAVPGLGSRPFILFLGRLHPKKGGDLLLRAFAATAALLPHHHLVMAGPGQDGHATALRDLATALGLATRVHWPGMLEGDAKWGALHGCTAFALPSHGENFGVAVAEALSCGKPVLLSHRVNIAADVRAAGAGLVEADTLPGTVALLARFAALPAAEAAALGQQARACFLNRFHADSVADRTLAILRDPEPFL